MLLWARLHALLSRVPARSVLTRSSRRSKGTRALRWVVALVVALEALYLVAANGILNFGGLPKLFGSTESVKAEISSGWTIFPGALHVRGLRITIQDYNVESTIEMDRADVVLRLRELPWHVFHAQKVRGSGLVFRFRNHVAPESKDLPRVRALPPIRGMEDPPVYKAWVPEAPMPDAEYHLWTVHIEDVDVRVDEMWVEQFRYRGRARAVGAFRLKPARNLWVGPASLELEPGRIAAGGLDALTGFAGRIDCTIHPFDVRVPQGLEVLRDISTKIRLHGDIADGQFVDLFLPPSARAHVEQKGAKVTIDVGLDHGVFTASSRVLVAGDSLHIQVGEVSADASGPWSIALLGDGKAGGGRAAAVVSRATLKRRGFDAPPMTIRDASAGATSTSLDATQSWGVRGAELTVGALVAPDLRVLNPLRLGSVRLRSGAGVLHGHVVDSGGVLSGAGSVELRQAVVDAGQTEIRGSASLKATAKAFDEHRRTGAFDIEVQGSEISAAAVSGDCPWADIKTAQAAAQLSLLPQGRASGRIDGSIDGARLSWGDLHVSGNADVRAAIEPTGAADGTESHVGGIVRVFQVRMKSGGGAPKRWDAQIPEATMDGSLALAGGWLDGPVEIKVKRVQASIGKVSMKADVRARLRIAGADLAERSGTVSGVVDIQKASLWNGDRRVEDWWAKLGVSPTRIVATQNLDIDGRVSARFRDGLPGLLALSETDQIPSFLPAMLPLHGLVGTLRVRRHCQLTDIGMSQIQGGPLVASGRIQSVPGETRGAVLVRLAGLDLVSAGVSLGEHGDGFSMFAGDTWLHKHLAGLDAHLASATVEPCEPPPQTKCD
jgi:hypothetical protein